MATDRRGDSWLRRERLTTSHVDTNPETYKKLLPEKKSKLGKWYQKRKWRKETALMQHAFGAEKQGGFERSAGGPAADYVESKARPIKSASERSPALRAALSLLTINPADITPSARKISDKFGTSDASARYGTALEVRNRRARDVRRADRLIGKKY
jgi:hypothetical protein